MYEEIRPLQLKELEILKELKRICNKYGMKYYLAYGTLIGAIRHKGFIPWDDDIDTAMLYSDYIKLEEVCKKELSSEFFLQTPDSEPNAGFAFFKLRMNNTTLIIDKMQNRDINHGIDIDIQPIYNVPDDNFHRKIQLINTAVYLLLRSGEAPQNHGKIYKAFASFLLLIFRGKTREKICKKCHKRMTAYEGIITKYKAKLFGNMHICRTLYPSEAFQETIEVPFEDELFSIPIGYDEILRTYYGDYMKMPPKEQQGVKLNHIIKCDTKNSYIKYKGILYCKKNGVKSVEK